MCCVVFMCCFQHLPMCLFAILGSDFEAMFSMWQHVHDASVPKLCFVDSPTSPVLGIGSMVVGCF